MFAFRALSLSLLERKAEPRMVELLNGHLRLLAARDLTARIEEQVATEINAMAKVADSAKAIDGVIEGLDKGHGMSGATYDAWSAEFGGLEGADAKRQAGAHLKTALGTSERRACAVVGADRTSIRYRAIRAEDGDIRSRRCYTCNKLVDQPWKIMSIGLRDWAREF